VFLDVVYEVGEPRRELPTCFLIGQSAVGKFVAHARDPERGGVEALGGSGDRRPEAGADPDGVTALWRGGDNPDGRSREDAFSGKSGEPIDGVLGDRGYAAVVFRREDDEAISGANCFFERRDRGRVV